MSDRGEIVVTLFLMAIAGGAVWVYCKVKIWGLADALQKAMAENAKLKVAIDAGGKTDEARKVSALTLAVLNAAYPSDPVLPAFMAKVEREEG
jgi:hypothetical protein